MRSLKLAAAMAVFAGLVVAPPTKAASPNGPSTTWNDSKYNRYDASAQGRPPGGLTHRVSVRTEDLSRLPRVGDAESYVVDDADADFDLEALFAPGKRVYSIGTNRTQAIGSNDRGTIWDATVYVYARSGASGGKACAFRAIVTPITQDGVPSVDVARVTGPVCATY